ncbi:hypothetical protein DV735_g2118, partial [Chaetothyriales sp. CBS 134920]
MAGPSPLRLDPALQKYYDMNKSRWKYFRWTPKNAFVGFVYAIFVPTIFGYALYSTEGKWNFRGKLRGDTIREW